jgi:hypothetical protein
MNESNAIGLLRAASGRDFSESAEIAGQENARQEIEGQNRRT